MKDSLKFRKRIVLTIVILIPLIASALIGIYAYNRYKGDFFNEYMAGIEEDTKERMMGYLKYSTLRYEEEPLYQQNVMKDGERVFTLEIYRITKNVVIDEEDKEIGEQLQYIFAIYNINYTRLIKVKGPDEKLSAGAIPAIYLKIKDQNDTSKSKLLTVSSPEDYVFIYDYNAAPEKDGYGNSIGKQFLKWVDFANEEFSEDVALDFILSDKPEDENDATYYKIITSVTLDDFKKELNDDEKATFKNGSEKDIIKAGYFVHVFKTRIWWQSLIAFVLVGFVSFSFYVVWNAEIEQSRKKGKGNKSA